MIKKEHFFINVIGFLGFALVMVAGVRFLMISDFIGLFITIASLLCLANYMNRFNDNDTLTNKEKRILRWLYIIMIVLVLFFGALILF